MDARICKQMIWVECALCSLRLAFWCVFQSMALRHPDNAAHGRKCIWDPFRSAKQLAIIGRLNAFIKLLLLHSWNHCCDCISRDLHWSTCGSCFAKLMRFTKSIFDKLRFADFMRCNSRISLNAGFFIFAESAFHKMRDSPNSHFAKLTFRSTSLTLKHLRFVFHQTHAFHKIDFRRITFRRFQVLQQSHFATCRFLHFRRIHISQNARFTNFTFRQTHVSLNILCVSRDSNFIRLMFRQIHASSNSCVIKLMFYQTRVSKHVCFKKVMFH